MSITINTTNLRDATAPLFCRYPNQINPQPAFVELDEQGNVSADYSGEIGNGMPMDVWYGRTLRWAVNSSINGNVLADALESVEITALLERIHAGHAVDWDGNNYVGSLTDDARAASDDLWWRLEDLGLDDEPAVWEVDNWLFGGCSLADHWADQPLSDAVAALEEEAESEGIYIDGDIETALLDQAAGLFDGPNAGKLTRTHVDALLADGRIDADAHAEWVEENNPE